MPTAPHEVFTRAEPAPGSKTRRANPSTVVFALGFMLASAAAVHFYVASRSTPTRRGFPPRLHAISKAYAHAQGWLVADNYVSGILMGIDIQCRYSSAICSTAEVSIAEGRMSIAQNELTVAEWTDSRIIAVNDEPGCRREFWILDLVAESTRLESVYKLPNEQVGNCDGLGTDTRKAHLGQDFEALRAMDATSR